MMRYCLLLLLLSLSLASFAQDEAWPVVENCLGELPYPTIPQEDWDFEGVIFNYNGEGVRAIRTDVETSYFIAFEDENNFPAVGDFSPDGRWFAYPTGATGQNFTMIGDSYLGISGLAVVSTAPHRTRQDYNLPDGYGSYTIAASYRSAFYPIIWYDNEQFAHFGTKERSVSVMLSISSGEFITDSPLISELHHRLDAWPDVIWSADKTSYAELERQNEMTLLYHNSTNDSHEIIAQNVFARGMAFSPDMKYFAFVDNSRLHLGNLVTEVVEDFCLELPHIPYRGIIYHNIFFSPDSQYLAFIYDGYPVLLNLETREMQILRYETESLMGWYPVAIDE